MAIKHRLLFILLLCWWTVPVSAQELKPFESGSYQAILDAQGTKPFVLAFWSIDCPPCFAELKMFGELLPSRPFDLILVSTDGPGAAAEVMQALSRFGLATANAWLFAAPAERLRFEIDRTWYGELPRSYLFRAGHRETISGTLKASTLEAWLEQQQP